GWPDRLSWLLAGGGALALAIDPAARGDFPAAVVGGLMVGLVLLVLACDLRERAVYPMIVYPTIGLAIALAPVLGTSVGDAVLGTVVSAALCGLCYIVARLRYGVG